ncbi:Tkl protein kinase, partial [Globisporangium splendens]
MMEGSDHGDASCSGDGDTHVHTAACPITTPHSAYPIATAADARDDDISDEDAFMLAIADAFRDETPGATFARVQQLLMHFPEWVDLANDDGHTALFFAICARDKELVQLLVDAGARADASAENCLVLACTLGDVVIVDTLLHADGAKFNDVYLAYGNISPLYAACKSGHLEIVELLVAHGAFLDDVDEDGVTPFMAAAGNGHLRIVSLLADQGAATERATPSGLSVAYYAAYSGYFRMLRFFVRERMALRDGDGNLTNLLDGAVRGGQFVIAKYLLETLNLADEDIDECLALAVRFRHLELVELLLEHDADVAYARDDGTTALHFAAQVGDAEITKVLLSHGANLTQARTTSTRYTPLHEMAKVGHSDLLAFVSRNRHETDFAAVFSGSEDTLTPLHLAAGNGHTDAVRVLVGIMRDCGVNVDVRGPRGQTPLIVAAESGFLEVVRVLVTLGDANVDARTDNGSTALIGASCVGEFEIVQFLCECGADVDLSMATMGRQQVTALHAASQYGHVDVVEYLLEQRNATADFTWTGTSSLLAGPVMNGHLFVLFILVSHGARFDDNDGQHLSPLHLAAQYKQLDVVSLLVLVAGVDVNAVNEFEEDGVALRSTPLIVAAQRGYVEIVECLCEHGADMELTTHDGKTALDVSREAQQADVVQYLIARQER